MSVMPAKKNVLFLMLILLLAGLLFSTGCSQIPGETEGGEGNLVVAVNLEKILGNQSISSQGFLDELTIEKLIFKVQEVDGDGEREKEIGDLDEKTVVFEELNSGDWQVQVSAIEMVEVEGEEKEIEVAVGQEIATVSHGTSTDVTVEMGFVSAQLKINMQIPDDENINEGKVSVTGKETVEKVFTPQGGEEKEVIFESIPPANVKIFVEIFDSKGSEREWDKDASLFPGRAYSVEFDLNTGSFDISVNWELPPAKPAFISGEQIGEEVQIEWSEVETADFYRLFRKEGEGLSWDLLGKTDSTEYIDEKIKFEKEYWYSVVAYKEDGLSSAFSSKVSVETVDFFKEIEFEDENLEEVIRDRIDKDEGPIYYKDVMDVTNLYANGEGIESLEGLQNLSSLRELEIGYDHENEKHNYINNIDPLKELTDLNRLDLSRNSISDISPLLNLNDLERLFINGNPVENLNKLENLTGLKELFFGHTPTPDNISFLENLTEMEILIFDNLDIEDISPLENLENLVRLDFTENQVTDISPLENLENLTWLHFNENQVDDIAPLENLEKLNNLNMWNNKVEDISPLENLENLRYLYLNNNKIEDLEAVSSLHNLNVLAFPYNKIEDITALQNLTNLNFLNMAGNFVDDISPLVENQGLGPGDEIWMQDNLLDLEEGSEDMENINDLIERGVEVDYTPQRE